MKSPICSIRSILTSVAACLLAGTALTAPAHAQTRFDRFYDSTTGSPERASSLEQTSDRGYIMVGTRAVNPNSSAIYAVKTNQHGVLQWSKTYSNPLGAPSNMFGSCVRQTRDGGYIIAGSTTNYGPNQLLLIKTDPLGNIVWQRAFQATVDTDSLRGPVVRERIGLPGGYVVIANVTNPSPNGPAAAGILLRTDAAGNYLSEHYYMDGRFQTSGTTIFRDVRQDADGTFVIVGTTFRTQTPALREALIFKTLPNSPLMFGARAYGPPADANDGESLELTSGGGYAFVGHRALPTNLTLFKTTPALAPVFNRLFIGLDTAYSLRENAWYDLVSTGISPFAGFNASTLMKNSLTGLFQWANQYPYVLPGEKDAAQGVPTIDGGYALTGWTNFGPNPANFSLVKADVTGRDCEAIGLQPQQPPWQPAITPIDLIPVQLDVFTQTQLIATPDQPRTDFTCFFPGCTTPPWNMVFWAPFDFSSPFADLAGGGGGIPVGGPASGAGYVGTSLCYNTGLTTYVDFPNSLSKNFNLGDFSMDAWVRRPNSAGPLNDGVRVILDKRSSYPNGTFRGYSMFLNNGSLGVQVATGPAINYGSGVAGTVPADGQWHFVAATVRRSGLGPVVTFYLDGAQAGPAVPVNPANIGASVNNPSRLRIGARITGGLVFPSVFHDCIDEVELFNRALAPAEVISIFQAQAAGKCREFCHTPIVQMCPTFTTVTTTAYICNYTTTPQTYTYSLQGLSVGPGCNLAGPNFAPISYAPVTALPGTCVPVTLTIPRPTGLANGLAGCWQFCVQSSSGASFCCPSKVVGNSALCFSDPTGGFDYHMVVARPIGIHLRIANESSQPIRLDSLRLRVADLDADGLPDGVADPSPMGISLNGLPPGVPWEVPPGLLIPPNGSVPLDTMAELVMGNEDNFHRFYTILLEADLDGDGEYEPLAGLTLHNDTPPPCPADFNLDGRANSQDFFDFIQAFFALDPSADVNADGAINSQDFFDFIQLFFAGCS